MIPVTGLNHAVLFVRELDRSVDFYKSIFGFVEVDRQRQMAFLRAKYSHNHHDLGLIALGARAPFPPRESVRLYHLAWQVAMIEDLAAAYQILQQTNCLRGASDHGTTKSIYGQDPDGYEFEILWQVPREHWGQYEHQAITRSLNLSTELKRFGKAPQAAKR